jgi:hypothetical protein
MIMASSQDAEALKDELATLAERVAQEGFGIRLDYSVDSVHHIDEILGALHKEFRRTKDDDGLNGVALEFAAYLVKVIEKNVARGRWNRDHPLFGPDTFPYEWQGGELFPYSWCQKRIFDGPGDDVWAKFHTLVLSKRDEHRT